MLDVRCACPPTRESWDWGHARGSLETMEKPRCSRKGRTKTRPRLSPPQERRMWTAVGARVVGLRRECMHLIVCTQHAVQRVVQSPTLQQPPPTCGACPHTRGIAATCAVSKAHVKRKTQNDKQTNKETDTRANSRSNSKNSREREAQSGVGAITNTAT